MTKARVPAGQAGTKPSDLGAALAKAIPGVDPTSAGLLMRASRLGRLVELYRGRLDGLDGSLDASSAAVLSALLMLGPPYRLSPTFLSRYVVQTSGGMTKTLRRLEAEGLISRVPDERDRRVSYVQLTREGKSKATSSLGVLLKEWQGALRVRGIDVDEAMATVTELVTTLEALTGARLGRDLGV